MPDLENLVNDAFLWIILITLLAALILGPDIDKSRIANYTSRCEKLGGYLETQTKYDKDFGCMIYDNGKFIPENKWQYDKGD